MMRPEVAESFGDLDRVVDNFRIETMEVANSPPTGHHLLGRAAEKNNSASPCKALNVFQVLARRREWMRTLAMSTKPRR